MQDDTSNPSPNTPLADTPPAEPAVQPVNLPPTSAPKLKRLSNWLATHKKVAIPLAILLVVVAAAATPWSRYHAAGLVIKKNFTVKVSDSTAGTPVSGALVSSGKVSALTNAEGVASLSLPVGPHHLTISKKYYAGTQSELTVPITGSKNVVLDLVATGRQVGLNVKDLLSGKSLSGVQIEVAGISAKTDSGGKALLVVPASSGAEQASLSLNGYNDAKVDLKISSQDIVQNDAVLTPAGKVYFLSKRTGKLNVMKSNLDGTGAEVVVAATGHEQVDSSALSRSPDGRYVVLETQRNDNDDPPQLYILSVSDDRLLTFDSGDFKFTIIGWLGDNLIYEANNNNLADWQAGKQKIKSYNAATGKTTVLDSTAAGKANTEIFQSFGHVYLTAQGIVFTKQWSGFVPEVLDGRKNTVLSIKADGQQEQALASYDAEKYSENLYRYAPNGFYIELDFSRSTDAIFYDFTVGGSFKKISRPTSRQLFDNPVYYFSPAGDQTYWSEFRDGKNTLITADMYGSQPSQKVHAAGYAAVGWYTDKYLLATNKDQNELYIMSPAASKPIKIADYQSTYVY
jgi:hypothetical protein